MLSKRIIACLDVRDGCVVKGVNFEGLRNAGDPAELLARVQQVRRQGWALVNQELEEGLISIAAPVRNRAGAVVAALNVSGQANRTPATVMKDSLLPQLRAAADEVSTLLVQMGRG